MHKGTLICITLPYRTLAPFGKYAGNKPLLPRPPQLVETLAHSRALPVPPLPPHLAAAPGCRPAPAGRASSRRSGAAPASVSALAVVCALRRPSSTGCGFAFAASDRLPVTPLVAPRPYRS
ncbi:hypothetical protein U1Q18_048900, partial [Sarracenia purpurea var. burkii]